MNSENNPNASSSTGTTSTSGPAKPQPTPHDNSKISEADYLTRQQEHAKAAISGVLSDMKQALAQGVSLREWTREHPWVLMGTAAAAGVAAGMLLTPSKEESFKEFFEEKWEQIKDKLTPTVPAESTRTAEPAQTEKPSALVSILRETIKALGPALGGILSGALAGQAVKEEPHNGHPPAGEYEQGKGPGV